MKIYRVTTNESEYLFTNKKKAIQCFNTEKNTTMYHMDFVQLEELNQHHQSGVYEVVAMLKYYEHP